jgi:hypothetical protein
MAERISENKIHILITSFIFILTITGSAVWFLSAPTITQGDTETAVLGASSTGPVTGTEKEGKHVVIYLNRMTLELHDGTTTLAIYPLLSQGKPGSYYETIGGSYTNDYKAPLHFSSIGHVYMPFSVHVFGNYFIHGIPYYPNGTPVSSAYSGGCIRLSNENAKAVYNFIEKGVPIIITRGSEFSFTGTPVSSSTLTSIEMTRLMVASISLEALTQDNEILSIDGRTFTTRKALLPYLLLQGNTNVGPLFARSIGEASFVDLMNKKAEALGMNNTHFSDVTSSVNTSYDDYERLMRYIYTYKSYLQTISY